MTANRKDGDSDQLPQTSLFRRFDLTGQRIKHWTVDARHRLVKRFRRLFEFIRSQGDKPLPGADQTIAEAAKDAPASYVKFIKSKLEESAIDNRLKEQQAETEFLQQELLREQARMTRAQTRGQQLDNIQLEIEIRQRLAEITKGRGDVSFISGEDGPVVIIGNLPVAAEGLELPERPPQD